MINSEIASRFAALAITVSLSVTMNTLALAQAPTDAQRDAMRSACRADYEAHCASVPPGGAASLQCLQKNLQSLSSGCQTAVRAIDTSAAPKAEAAPHQRLPVKSRPLSRPLQNRPLQRRPLQSSPLPRAHRSSRPTLRFQPYARPAVPTTRRSARESRLAVRPPCNALKRIRPKFPRAANKPSTPHREAQPRRHPARRLPRLPRQQPLRRFSFCGRCVRVKN
jgi:hypothetical protein